VPAVKLKLGEPLAEMSKIQVQPVGPQPAEVGLKNQSTKPPVPPVTFNVYAPVNGAVKVYTFSAPGVLKPQEEGFQLAPEPDNVTVWFTPQVAVPNNATEQGSGSATVQLVHCTVVVRQVLCVTHPGRLQCAKSVPVKVFAKVNGITPKPITGPFDDPVWIVTSSPAMLEVNFNVWPATAPEIVENSPANEQVESVTAVPVVLIVPLPNELVNVHCAIAPPTERKHKERRNKSFFIS
jgi:hypothetical protein